MVCILALPLTEVPCYSALNAITWSNYATEYDFYPGVGTATCIHVHLMLCTFAHVHIIIHFPEKAQISNVILAGEYN